MNSFRHNLHAIVLLMVATLGLAACESATEPEEDHAEEVEGVVLVMAGQTLASYDGDTGTWTGELEVDLGEETGHIEVDFVNHSGVKVALDEDFYLMVDVENESIAEFEQDSPGGFDGHLHGVAEGDTEMTFSLMHGAVGSGHADFVTAPVHVHVH